MGYFCTSTSLGHPHPSYYTSDQLHVVFVVKGCYLAPLTTHVCGPHETAANHQFLTL